MLYFDEKQIPEKAHISSTTDACKHRKLILGKCSDAWTKDETLFSNVLSISDSASDFFLWCFSLMGSLMVSRSFSWRSKLFSFFIKVFLLSTLSKDWECRWLTTPMGWRVWKVGVKDSNILWTDSKTTGDMTISEIFKTMFLKEKCFHKK